jgi:hypothetical protein
MRRSARVRRRYSPTRCRCAAKGCCDSQTRHSVSRARRAPNTGAGRRAQALPLSRRAAIDSVICSPGVPRPAARSWRACWTRRTASASAAAARRSPARLSGPGRPRPARPSRQSCGRRERRAGRMITCGVAPVVLQHHGHVLVHRTPDSRPTVRCWP